MTNTVISYPIPPYSNPPIQPQYYQPSRFVISAITLGVTTYVTTSVAHNYVIGQEVRLLIPKGFGTVQISGLTAIVISIPSTTQIQLDIDSTRMNAFIAVPFVANITAITQASPAVLTVNNNFLTGGNVLIEGVVGMTQLNGNIYTIVSSFPTTLTLQINSTAFSAYVSGGTATLFPKPNAVPQIIAIGDINTGPTNTSGRTNNITYIPGSFIDISPN